jgi:hypothetical protein
MSTSTDLARARAEAQFKKKEQQARDGEQARAEYNAQQQAMREKTARLRALRLARDRSADGITHEEYGGISKRAARKKPCVEAGLK